MGAIKNLQIKAHELARNTAREIESDIEALDVYYDIDEYETPQCEECEEFCEEEIPELGSVPCPHCGHPVFRCSDKQRMGVRDTVEVDLCAFADKVLELVFRNDGLDKELRGRG